MKFTHIINPFISNDMNNKIVNLTLDSMINAKNSITYDDLSVNLCYTCYEEDLLLLEGNKHFKKLSLLERSILDIKQFNKQRKLPLLFDILDKTNELDSDYIIYTNIDIHLVPNFYNEVYKYILLGYETVTINRVTVYHNDILNASIDDIYKLVPNGEFHPGLDCFIIKKDVLDSIPKVDFCVGINYFDKFLYNYVHKNSNKSVHFVKSYLTFHIGDDRDWLDESVKDYRDYNFDLYNNFNCGIQDVYCEFGVSKDDDYLYFTKYHYSYCENEVDKPILNYFRKNKFYEGKFLDIGAGNPKINSKTYFLNMCYWSGYLIEYKFDMFKELNDEYKNNSYVNLINAKIGLNTKFEMVDGYMIQTVTMEQLINKIGSQFDFITLNIDENYNILKTFPIDLLFNCKLISVNYNTVEEMYNIKYHLNKYGFNEIVNKTYNNITLSKY